jgi:hypothetical protein
VESSSFWAASGPCRESLTKLKVIIGHRSSMMAKPCFHALSGMMRGARSLDAFDNVRCYQNNLQLNARPSEPPTKHATGIVRLFVIYAHANGGKTCPTYGDEEGKTRPSIGGRRRSSGVRL